MKFLILSIFLTILPTTYSQVKETDKIAKSFIEKLDSGKLDSVLSMYLTAKDIKQQLENPPAGAPVPPKEMIPKILKRFEDMDVKNSERIATFLKEYKKMGPLKFKEASGGIAKSPQGRHIPFFRIIFETKDKKELSLDMGTAAEIKGQWKFVKEFPDAIFIKQGQGQLPIVIGLESKKNSIQTAVATFSTLTNGSMGSQLISMVCNACCVRGFEDKYKKVSFEERHLKGGFIGIPWNKLTQKQKLKREELKLVAVKDLSETEIIATFRSATHEISAPMTVERNRWLFTLGKAEVFLIQNGKKAPVDLGQL